MGGLARRATVIKGFKGQGRNALILDAGNSLFQAKGSPSSVEKQKAKLIARAYQQMGYQAVNVGSEDLLAGIEFLKEIQKDTHVPFLSTNLLDTHTGRPVFKSHVVLDLGGIRVGLFGLTSDVRQNEGPIPGDYFISDPIAAAKRAAAELSKDCDIIVALGNMVSPKEYTELVQQVKEVHFIFGSGGKGSYHRTIQSEGGRKAFLFEGYSKGQYLGRLNLEVVKGNRDFVDFSRQAQLERQIDRIERQLESYRRGTGWPKSIPQDQREKYIKRLEEFKKRSEDHLNKLERNSHGKSTFTSTRIPLDGKVKDDLEIRELLDRFKKGS